MDLSRIIYRYALLSLLIHPPPTQATAAVGEGSIPTRPIILPKDPTCAGPHELFPLFAHSSSSQSKFSFQPPAAGDSAANTDILNSGKTSSTPAAGGTRDVNAAAVQDRNNPEGSEEFADRALGLAQQGKGGGVAKHMGRVGKGDGVVGGVAAGMGGLGWEPDASLLQSVAVASDMLLARVEAGSGAVLPEVDKYRAALTLAVTERQVG